MEANIKMNIKIKKVEIDFTTNGMLLKYDAILKNGVAHMELHMKTQNAVVYELGKILATKAIQSETISKEE